MKRHSNVSPHGIVFAAVFCGMLFAADKARADVQIRLNWDTVYTEISPRQQTYNGTGGQNLTLGNGFASCTCSKTTMLPYGRQSMLINKHGVKYFVSVRIRNGHIVATQIWPGQMIVTADISTGGQSSCSASIDVTPIRGQRYVIGYRLSNGEKMIISTYSTQNISCQISEK